MFQSLNSSIGTCNNRNGLLVRPVKNTNRRLFFLFWAVLDIILCLNTSTQCRFFQKGIPSRDGSIVLRYIPDPTDKLLDDAFQAAPGEYSSSLTRICATTFESVWDHPERRGDI